MCDNYTAILTENHAKQKAALQYCKSLHPTLHLTCIHLRDNLVARCQL